ncbi:MAG: nitroreductase family protein [Candidatus Heimdallarchaeaceae archaeon]
MKHITDKYQNRYLAHQRRKARLLANTLGSHEYYKYTKREQDIFYGILENRCSQRSFNKEPIDIKKILQAIETAPSSCDRKGVEVRIIDDKDKKALLSGLLVGGVGWIQRANTILLLIANKDCYKNPAEKDFMPYLDAGVIIQTTYLVCEVMNYGCCFVNPNIRENNIDFFKERFDIKDNELFCGALAIGKYDFKQHKKFTV